MTARIKHDLKKSYESFFHFSLGLIEKLDSSNNNLQFAVVNMQVALELFLKFYFIEIGKEFFVFKKETETFKPFSEILDKIFSDKNVLIAKKKILKQILESRNNIVHQGKHNQWSDDLANDLISCTLFIQGLLNKEFNTSLIQISYGDNQYSKNQIWKNGAENFAKNIADLNKTNVYECIFCCSLAMVDKKLFNLDEYNDEGFQCITCFRNLTLEDQMQLAFCKACSENSFIVDHLNPQKDKSYSGLCINCGMKYISYCCEYCDKYFIDFDNERLIIEDKIFCDKKCLAESKTTDNNASKK